MLAYSQANWEEKTYTIMSGDWQAAKDAVMDFPNLPYIIDGDLKLSETIAVHFYIAEKYCPALLGSTPEQRARAIQLHKIGDEQFINAIKLCFADGNDKAGVTAKLMEGLGPLGNLLNDDRQFLTGDSPCIADFVLFEQIEYANHLTKDLEEKTYTRYPKLEAYRNRMAGLPGLSEYLASEQHAATAAAWVPSPPAKVNLN